MSTWDDGRDRDDDPDRVPPASAVGWNWSDPDPTAAYGPPAPPGRSRASDAAPGGRSLASSGSLSRPSRPSGWASRQSLISGWVVVVGSSPPARSVAQQQLNASEIAAQIDPAIVDITSTLSLEGATAAGTGIWPSTLPGEVLTSNQPTSLFSGETSITAKGGQPLADLQRPGACSAPTPPTTWPSSRSSVRAFRDRHSRRVLPGHDRSARGRHRQRLGPARAAEGHAGNHHLHRPIHHGARRSRQVTPSSAQQSDPDQRCAPTRQLGWFTIDAANGRVIGMNTIAAAADSTDTMFNVGFAIPIDAANSIVQQIQGGHESTNVRLGRPRSSGVRLQPDGTERDPADLLAVVGRGGRPERQWRSPASGAAPRREHDHLLRRSAGLVRGVAHSARTHQAPRRHGHQRMDRHLGTATLGQRAADLGTGREDHRSWGFGRPSSPQALPFASLSPRPVPPLLAPDRQTSTHRCLPDWPNGGRPLASGPRRSRTHPGWG